MLLLVYYIIVNMTGNVNKRFLVLGNLLIKMMVRKGVPVIECITLYKQKSL